MARASRMRGRLPAGTAARIQDAQRPNVEAGSTRRKGRVHPPPRVDLPGHPCPQGPPALRWVRRKRRRNVRGSRRGAVAALGGAAVLPRLPQIVFARPGGRQMQRAHGAQVTDHYETTRTGAGLTRDSIPSRNIERSGGRLEPGLALWPFKRRWTRGDRCIKRLRERGARISVPKMIVTLGGARTRKTRAPSPARPAERVAPRTSRANRGTVRRL